MRTGRLLAAAASASIGLALTACGTSAPATSASSTAISFTDGSCGVAWHLAKPGWHTFEITNEADYGAEVDLTNPANGAVYDELQNIGPGTTAPMSLDVGSGKYAFLCEVEDFDPVTGPTVTVSGHAPGARAVLPITYDDIIPLAKQYAQYTEAGLQVLAAQTATLAAAVRAGDLAAAKRDWLTAHLQYETLGAAYDAFGNFDDEIDGRADAVGVDSRKWTGFYRLEYGLWHGQPEGELSAVADTLNTNVHQLLSWWPGQQIPLIDVGLRTHEQVVFEVEVHIAGPVRMRFPARCRREGDRPCGQIELQVGFSRRIPERDDEKSQELKSHIEHGRQVQAHFLLRAFLLVPAAHDLPPCVAFMARSANFR